MASSSSLEQQLDSLWEQSRAARKTHRIDELKNEASRKITADLETVNATVQESLEKDRERRREKIEGLQNMVSDFIEGAKAWHSKSRGSMEEVKRSQAMLNEKVTEVSRRLAKRRREMEDAQQEREGQVHQHCRDIIEHCRQQIDQSTEL
jgi:archaellum component FlaC